jgi:hypothetical protein
MKTKAIKTRAVKPEPVKIYIREGYTEENQARNVAEGISQLIDSPIIWNGEGRLFRYRITVEEIPESNDVLIERLTNLWETTKYNHHHSNYFSMMAKKLGIVLDPNTRGSKISNSKDPVEAERCSHCGHSKHSGRCSNESFRGFSCRCNFSE